MVHNKRNDMILFRKPNKKSSDQRAARQVEWTPRKTGENLLCLVTSPRQVNLLELKI
jgi:hypothetical protein